VGLVADVHGSSLATDIKPTIYVPYSQVQDETMKGINGWFVTSFVLRTAERANVAESDIAKAAEAAITSVDPEVPASKFATMQSFIDRNVAAPGFSPDLQEHLPLLPCFLLSLVSWPASLSGSVNDSRDWRPHGAGRPTVHNS
jgi:hypothetical protein